MLSQEAKAIILCPFSPNKHQQAKPYAHRKPPFGQQQAIPPRRTIHEHELDYLTSCLHKLHGGNLPPESSQSSDDGNTSVHEDTPEPMLAYVTKKKPLPPGNVKRLLSPATNGKPKQDSNDKPQEVNLNGIVYKQVTVSIIYSISSSQAAQSKGALIDRGANDGIAGDDVRIIAKTDKSVNI